MKSATLLILGFLSTQASARGPIGSGGPNQQIVSATISVATPDIPGARQECESGQSLPAQQAQALAHSELERQCGKVGVSFYQMIAYTAIDRQDGVPSFDCRVDVTAACKVVLNQRRPNRK